MLEIRRNEEIHHADGGWFRARWHFSFDSYRDPHWNGVGPLRVFNHDELAPGAIWPMHPHADIEGITYVWKGTFRHADSLRNGGVLHPFGGRTVMASSEVCRIVDAIPGLAWSCAPNGDFDYFNQRWCDYSGMSLTDACAGGWRDAIHPDDFDRVFQWGLERRRTGQAGEVEARLRRSDGVSTGS